MRRTFQEIACICGVEKAAKIKKSLRYVRGIRKVQKAERGCERSYHGCCNNVDAQGLEISAVNRSSIVPKERVSCG